MGRFGNGTRARRARSLRVRQKARLRTERPGLRRSVRGKLGAFWPYVVVCQCQRVCRGTLPVSSGVPMARRVSWHSTRSEWCARNNVDTPLGRALGRSYVASLKILLVLAALIAIVTGDWVRRYVLLTWYTRDILSRAPEPPTASLSR